MRMSKRRRFDGVAHFPESLPVEADALGSVHAAKIGSHKVTFTLPVAGSGMSVVAPKDSRGNDLMEPVLREFKGYWGYRSTERLYYISMARASFLLTPTPNIATSKEYGELGSSFFSWFDIVWHWTAAWSGEPLNSQIGDLRNSAFHVPTGDGRMAGTGTSLGGIFLGATPLSRSQVEGAFRRASAGQHLPTEHQLILASQSALLEGDLRRAVIDAGTAVEVALSSAVARELRARKVAPDFIDKVIINANGMAGLLGLYEAVGNRSPVSRNRLNNELAEVRNKAAHGGHIPLETKAQIAIDHASAIVAHAQPLPQS